jgi:hypothetical protein
MNPITLTTDQQAALDSILKFLADPLQPVFVLSGYSGCGKSTLMQVLLDKGVPDFNKTMKLLNPSYRGLAWKLTATTNKAAENLARIAGGECTTIHSALGLRVRVDYKTGVTTLIPKSNEPALVDTLLIVDEASYCDKQLLNLIFRLTRGCKVLFVGDPAQLTQVGSNGAPVFDAGFPGAHLSQVVRQAEGNPIVDLSTKFRNTVNTGQFFQFTPDGHHIQYLDRDAFRASIDSEFDRPDWKFSDSKILAWTNKCVIGFNHYVRNQVKGDPHFQVGDYAVCNNFVTNGRKSIKTDQLVEITHISEPTSSHGVPGLFIEVDHSMVVFMPSTLAEKNNAIRRAKAEDRYDLVRIMEEEWADLRAAYAQTINKSQGSTYDKVFIDLDDVARCNSGEQIARMLYVGVSRARHNVFLTGDIA